MSVKPTDTHGTEAAVGLSLMLLQRILDIQPKVLLLLLLLLVAIGVVLIFVLLHIIAPIPRKTLPSEHTYITTSPDGSVNGPLPLSCWHDRWLDHRLRKGAANSPTEHKTGDIEDATVTMSVVIPAYNEEERLEIMLEEAVAYLDTTYGRPESTSPNEKQSLAGSRSNSEAYLRAGKATPRPSGPSGYEILLIDDGSTDKTVEVALRFSQQRQLHDVLRIVRLEQNRGKGGAVTHGFRHVRGQYAVFADADGASKFSDLGKLVAACNENQDEQGRCVSVGSRAHLVGSDAVVQRSMLRNALMHSFHLLLRLLTPPATSRIRDTQCGFKLFSRSALPYIIPYMHAEGWIFDVEMLMLAESAPAGETSLGSKAAARGINVAEVPIGWHEVKGSKLNVLWDSIGMAWGLAILRACWMFGVYRRR